jgi:hypothetical protein
VIGIKVYDRETDISKYILEFDDTEECRRYGKNISKQYDFVFNFKRRFGWVYLIITERHCKIGITSDLNSRLQMIKNQVVTESIQRIYISPLCKNNRKLEKQFKICFKNTNVKNEWYSLERISEYLSFLQNVEYVFPDINKEIEEELWDQCDRATDMMTLYLMGDVNKWKI